MARIFTKELMLNPNTDAFKKYINDMRYNAAAENRNQWAAGISDVAKSFGDVGKAFYEDKQIQDRLASVDDTDLEYRNDPVWIAAKEEYARTGDSSKLNAVKSQFVAQAQAKAKQDEIDAMKAKADKEAIETAQLEYAQNMAMFDKTGDDRYMNAAEKEKLKLKQLGGEVKEFIVPKETGEYTFQKEAAEKEYAEKEAAFDKEKDEKKAQEAKEEKEIISSEKNEVEHNIEKYNQEVDAARKIKNTASRKAKLLELSKQYKDLTTVANIYRIDKLPTIINEDEYIVSSKPVANKNTIVFSNADKQKYVLPKGFYWKDLGAGKYQASEEDK